MATIGAADAFGFPVSTTHVLSSGVAGSMAVNHSGLQWGTVRNLQMAWVLTLPVAMMLSGSPLLDLPEDFLANCSKRNLRAPSCRSRRSMQQFAI